MIAKMYTFLAKMTCNNICKLLKLLLLIFVATDAVFSKDFTFVAAIKMVL